MSSPRRFSWYFMPAVLVIYWILPRGSRNVLWRWQAVFYAYGAGPFVAAAARVYHGQLLAGVVIDADRPRPQARRNVLVGAIAFDVAVLVIWKYAGFASRQIHAIVHAIRMDGHRSSPHSAGRHLVHLPPPVTWSTSPPAGIGEPVRSSPTLRCSRS
jgi:D-alanyl-lipoteichoic acid acyltransferase DltB (MBOAT superfamily)